MTDNSVALLVGCADGLGLANGEDFFHFCSDRLPTKQTEKPIALALDNNLHPIDRTRQSCSDPKRSPFSIEGRLVGDRGLLLPLLLVYYRIWL
ncbi:MAG: hypothetical protein VKJ24_17635 [Synechococcales bacterium]|nr:hypothetical protein [Synechococcales bacterium]